MKTYWREEHYDYAPEAEEREMFEALLACNLPEHFKFGVLAKMSGYDTRKEGDDCYIREVLLRTLARENRPMRVSEFTWGDIENNIENPNAPLYNFTTQRITAHFRFLCAAGLVDRIEVKTGKFIQVAPNKSIEEIITYFQIRG